MTTIDRLPTHRRHWARSLRGALLAAVLAAPLIQVLPASAASIPASMVGECETTTFCFRPATVTVQVGDSVVWTNTTIAFHTAQARDGSWTTKDPLRQGESSAVRFGTAGTFPYLCKYHPDMLGTVIVVAPPSPPTSAPGPTATPAGRLAPTGGGPPLLPLAGLLALASIGLMARLYRRWNRGA